MYIKKYEMGESYSVYDVEDKCPVISLAKPERMRTIGRHMFVNCSPVAQSV